MNASAVIDLQALKARHPLADVVEASGIPLRGRGRVLQGPCPFHEEIEPSFTVYQDSQRYFCFGCQAKGDVFDFLQRIQHIDLPDAVRLLEGTIPRTIERRVAPAPPPPVRDPAVLAAAAVYYAACLRRVPEAQGYLRRRGIRPETAAALGLGYSPGTGLRPHLRCAGFKSEAIVNSGLFLSGEERFAGRIVVPDVAHGRVTWLTGRTIGAAEPRFQALPYAKPLFGRGRLRGPRAVVLTEGLFDWMTLMQWGIPACATLGGHGYDRVAAALGGCSSVYVVMDADEAGRAATGQLTALLGRKTLPVSLPHGVKDVAELAVHPRSGELFARLLQQARRAV